jgi:IS30 family transposase
MQAPGVAMHQERATSGTRSTDFRALTQSDLDNVAAELNGRPRQTLGWKSPCQALDEALQ